jgi:hypothetical protein
MLELDEEISRGTSDYAEDSCVGGLEEGVREDQFLRDGLNKPKSAKLCQRMFPEM